MSARTKACPTARSRRNTASDSTSGNSGTLLVCLTPGTVPEDHPWRTVVPTGSFGGNRSKEALMGFVKTMLKGAVVAKLVQVAQRELSKPENQQKIKQAVQK